MAPSHASMPGPARKWIARFLVPVLLLSVLGPTLRWLPPRPRLTVVCPEGPAEVSFSHDGRLLATQAVDSWGQVTGPLRVWSTSTGQEQSIPFDSSDVSGRVTFLPGGELLAEYRYDRDSHQGTQRLLETATGEEWLRLDSLAWCCRSPDGSKLAFIRDEPAREAAVEVWDLAARRREATLGPGRPVATSRDGRLVVLITNTDRRPKRGMEELQVWDVVNREERGRLCLPWPANLDTMFSPDGETLAVNCYGHKDGCLKLWDVKAGCERATLPQAYRFAFVSDGHVLAATGLAGLIGSRVRYWDVATGRELDALPLTPSAGTFNNASLRASPDGRTLAVEIISQVPQRRSPVRLPAWRWLSALRDQEEKQLRELRLFEVATGRELGTLPGSEKERYAFSPDGRVLAVARGDGSVEVWPVPPGKPVWLALGLSGAFVLVVLLSVRWVSAHRKRGTATTAAGVPSPTPS